MACVTKRRRCTDDAACNYDPSMQVEDGACTYPEEDVLIARATASTMPMMTGCVTKSKKLAGARPPMPATMPKPQRTTAHVKHPVVVSGCTDSTACNYNAEATEDDSSCEYTSCVVSGCTDELACNYDAAATEEDGSCDYCSCQRPPTPYTLVVEGVPAVVAGMTTYRFYVTLPDEGDRFSAVFGNNDSNLEVSACRWAYNSSFNSS